MKALIVDDNPKNIAVLANYLEKNDIQIFAAQEGESAVKRALLTDPDIILLDVMLPGIDGYEVCRLLKKEEKTKKIPIIMMTVLDDLEHQLQGFRAGAVDFITKPFHQEVVLARIRAHIELHELTEKQEEIINKRTETLNKTNQQLRQEISERKKAEEVNLMLQEQILQSQKMEAIGQLAGGIAHDFNNILGGILNSAGLLERSQENLDEKGLRYIKWITEASERAGDLVSQLLAFSRKEEREIKIVNMVDLINEIIQILNRTFTKEIKIKARISAKNYMVKGNPSALHSAFLNMAINANHAIEKTGKIDFIFTNLTINSEDYVNSTFQITSGEFCCIEVKDTGSGIAHEDMQRIFEPFFTTKDAGKGTGLGLAVTFGTVRNHKGLIEVSSEIGQGTSFKVYLPITNEEDSQGPVEKEGGFVKKNILLVDDEEINRETGMELLQSLGHKVFTADSGEKALEIYVKENIQIVLLDMIMPGMDGSETFTRLKEIDQKCTVIISTGYANSYSLKEMEKKGLAGILYKPYQVQNLQDLISQL